MALHPFRSRTLQVCFFYIWAEWGATYGEKGLERTELIILSLFLSLTPIMPICHTPSHPTFLSHPTFPPHFSPNLRSEIESVFWTLFCTATSCTMRICSSRSREHSSITWRLGDVRRSCVLRRGQIRRGRPRCDLRISSHFCHADVSMRSALSTLTPPPPPLHPLPPPPVSTPSPPTSPPTPPSPPPPPRRLGHYAGREKMCSN